MTAIFDSDEESLASPPPPPVAVTAAMTPSWSGEVPRAGLGLLGGKSLPVLSLPTRWSDQDRQPQLSISDDGRELILTGESRAS